MPPPCRVIAALPVRALPVTPLCMSATGPPGGPLGIGASKMPPPWAVPLRPLAWPLLPLTVVLSSVNPPSSATRPPPRIATDPCGAEAWTWLLLTALFVIEPKKIDAPARALTSPAAELTVTLLPLMRLLLIVPCSSPAAESPPALPVEPGSAVELTLLLAMTPLLIWKWTPRSTWTPPEKAVASPIVFVMLTELPETVLLLIAAAGTLPVRWIPPATAAVPDATSVGIEASRLAVLFVTALPLIASVPPTIMIPPPSAKRPFGAVAAVRLPPIVVLLTGKPASQLMIAPPSASLATVDSPDAEPTRLLLTVVFASVSVPQLSIPPPAARANGRSPLMHEMVMSAGQGIVESIAVVGATWFPVITLFEIVTAAPPVKSEFGGISTPPPSANTPSWPVNGIDSGLERVRPPVIVTPSTETVGSLEAPKVPIVRTGPPPLITV